MLKHYKNLRPLLRRNLVTSMFWAESLHVNMSSQFYHQDRWIRTLMGTTVEPSPVWQIQSTFPQLADIPKSTVRRGQSTGFNSLLMTSFFSQTVVQSIHSPDSRHASVFNLRLDSSLTWSENLSESGLGRLC